jgi:hypothetical protein
MTAKLCVRPGRPAQFRAATTARKDATRLECSKGRRDANAGAAMAKRTARDGSSRGRWGLSTDRHTRAEGHQRTIRGSSRNTLQKAPPTRYKPRGRVRVNCGWGSRRIYAIDLDQRLAHDSRHRILHMAIIEPYITEHSDGPRRCQLSTTDYPQHSAEKPCFAELILHTESGEKFLCRRHASGELRDNPTLLAAALIELSLSLSAVPA